MDSSSPRSPLDDGEIVDDDSKEFDDGFDENLMGDDEDKRKLAQMTEKQREEELFKRSERRETLKIRFEIERKLRAKSKKRKQEEKQSKQIRSRKRLRASEIYSSDESSDDSDEYVPDPDKSSTANDLNTTGGKSSKMNTRASSTLLSDSSSASASPSSSSSSDSEPERDDLNADDDSRMARDDFLMTLADLRAIQLRRDEIEKWVYSPFFKETAIGLFVKISTGQNSKNPSQHIYKVAQILDITRGNKVYDLDDKGKHKTDKQCQVKIGNVERTYRMHFVSNRKFEDDDYDAWRATIESGGDHMPSRDHYMRKKLDLRRAINYEYTNEDIAYEIEERKRFNQNQGSFAMRKTELIRAKAEADDLNDYDKAREIQQMLDELEEEAKRQEMNRSSSKFTAISFVNERNRIKNIEESERVLKESKAVKTEDPFTRRKCNPTIVHNKNTANLESNQGDTNESTDKNGHGSNKNRNSTNGNSSNNSTADAKVEAVKSVNDLFHAHASIDLDLDLDII